jgi:protein-tyrosine phosphatase
VASSLAQSKKLSHIIFDSAGTSSYHAGKHPDPRSIAIAQKHGIDIAAQISRQIIDNDFINFDYILVMDRDNFANLMYLAPDEQKYKIHLLLDFLPSKAASEVPDPYLYNNGFELIYNLISDAVGHFLEELSNKTI